MRTPLPRELELVNLRDEHWDVVVAPAHGGSLQRCEFDGQHVLMPAPGGGAPWPSRCYFPLIPFSNRVENSEFQFAGTKVRLRGHVAGTPHAMHGHGWCAAWYLRSRTATGCSLVYRHEANSAWPWRYEGTQSFGIAGDTLRITLAVRNLGATAMPCGLGFHPFFPASTHTRLQFQAARVWNGSAREFPRERLPVPRPLCFDAGARISERRGTDHCYDGWQRRALLSHEGARHDIIVEGCEATDFLVVYIPEGADHLCVEPVTHAVNAMNLPDPAAAGLWTLQPAQGRQITMRISRQPAKNWAR